MEERSHFDAIVIGSGPPGGEGGASIKLAKAGKSVAVVEKHSLVGGGCTHWGGTIPPAKLSSVSFSNFPMRKKVVFSGMFNMQK